MSYKKGLGLFCATPRSRIQAWKSTSKHAKNDLLKPKLLCVLSGILFQERACKMLFTVYDILLSLKLHAVFMAKPSNLLIVVIPQ